MQGLPKNTTPKGVEIFHQGSFVHPCIADTAVTIFASGKMVEYAFERNRNGCGMQMIPMKKNNTPNGVLDEFANGAQRNMQSR